jgi:dihydroorotate dehydrogenase electron transfer subunit
MDEVRQGGGYARLRVALDSPLPGPGQFFMVRFPWGPALPRALSVLGAEGGWIDLFVKMDGLLRGEMARSPRGAVLEIRGPYGVPYAERIDCSRRYVLVGGGSGIAPLLHFAEVFPNLVAATALGFRSAGVRALLPGVDLAAEDESGETADARLRASWREGLGVIACGPDPLLASVSRQQRDNPAAFVSLETRLGCGFGACRGCSIPTPAGTRRVCVDGPLFACSEVPWLA